MEFVISDLSKSFDKKSVLKNINFKFSEGKIYGILGRNGSGKTTLFNCINKDIKYENGNFYLIQEQSKSEINVTDVNLIPSTPNVPNFLTGNEFIKFYTEINDITDTERINEVISLLNLANEDLNKLLKDYSHGMKNKIQMLTCILSNSKLLLFDEPFTALDVVVSEEIKKIIKEIKRDKIILFSTHILDLAIDMCDEIVLLHNGSLSILDKENLSDKEFREKIINTLKESN